MVARHESWSQPGNANAGRAAPLLAALAVALFFAAWGGLHYGFYARNQIVDTPIYERYGDAMDDGFLPYRDFGVEYPPAALPVFWIPSATAQPGDFDSYRRTFEALMAICGALLTGLVALTLSRSGAGAGRVAAGAGFAALAPLALGSVVLSRFDLWPAVLTVGALAAIVSGRERLGSAVLGVGIAAKVYPAVLVPLAVAYVWRRSGRREALVWLGILAAVVLAIFLPFLVVAPGGVWDSVVRQTTRPLQIESLGSAFLLAAHQIYGTAITMRSGHGSQNLAGSGPDALAALQSVLQVGALLAIWVWFARSPADRNRLLRASAAAVCAFLALGKVLSPQYLIWLVPLVPLVRGRRGLAAGALLAAAMVLTQLWFPYRYWSLALDFAAFPSWLVLARDLVLVALLAVLVWPERTGSGTVPAPVR